MNPVSSSKLICRKGTSADMLLKGRFAALGCIELEEHRLNGGVCLFACVPSHAEGVAVRCDKHPLR